MSNYLAIATVTTVLQRMLQASIQADVDGARVTTVRPESAGGAVPETGVNLYLYNVVFNPAWRNSDLRTRTSDGQFSKRPQAAVDLHYLITCYGNDVELEPQRLMGSALRTLHSQPVLTREMIEEAIEAGSLSALQSSNLADQIENIKLMPLPLTSDELSNIWSVFFQTPYALSVAYQAGVVLIESEDIPQRALPVRERRFATLPSQPAITEVVAAAGAREPITAAATLKIRGQRLRYEVVRLRIGRIEVSPDSVTDSEIVVNLATLPPGSLQAGVQSVQVLHRKSSDLLRGVESNAAPFVLCPIVTDVQVANVQGDATARSADVTIGLNPPVEKGQRFVLMLNQRNYAPGTRPAAYTFDAIKRESASDRVTVPIREVKPGDYLVRVQVDGAESRLVIDTDRASPTVDQYIAPCVVIP